MARPEDIANELADEIETDWPETISRSDLVRAIRLREFGGDR